MSWRSSFGAWIEKAISGRWIAGADVSDALQVSKRFNARGINTLINYLGEDFKDRVSVNDALRTYMKLARRIASSGAHADISLKPTQLGLLISQNLFERNYSAIVSSARRLGIFVWLDMESHEHVDATIAAYLRNLRKGNVGICIQAYLHRSAADIAMLSRKGAVVRLVKGAYPEPPSIAYKSWPKITSNYAKLMRYLFAHSKRFMLATHDLAMISKARKLNRHYHKYVEYGMLNGIRNHYAVRLAEHGEHVSAYVPFGKLWVDYSLRRLKEMSHVSLLLQTLFERQSV